ncbi:MAG: hypothetical protein KIT44_02015 [Opitutaceae bacterium]|nr:hypothetical protein [Opitutaceae bacterium]
MKLADVKQAVAQWPEAEKIHLAAYLKHIARRDNPVHQAELDRACESMTKGERISLEEFRRIEAKLTESGL